MQVRDSRKQAVKETVTTENPDRVWLILYISGNLFLGDFDKAFFPALRHLTPRVIKQKRYFTYISV